MSLVSAITMVQILPNTYFSPCLSLHAIPEHPTSKECRLAHVSLCWEHITNPPGAITYSGEGTGVGSGSLGAAVEVAGVAVTFSDTLLFPAAGRRKT